MARNDRQWLTPKSDSFEAFAFFLVRLVLAVFVTVAVARWALGADVSDLGSLALWR